MAQRADDEDEKPLDPAVERVRRRVMRFIAINLGILFVALMAVAIAIVYRLSSRPDAPPADLHGIPFSADEIIAQGTIPLPQGARVVSQSLSGNRIAVEIELSGGGRQILIYDLATGQIAGRFALTVEP